MTRDMNVYGKFTDIYSYGKKVMLLTLLMVLGATGAWGQPDYSGTYYIGSVGYNSSNTANNYYLCPTEGWCYFVAPNTVTGNNNEQICPHDAQKSSFE